MEEQFLDLLKRTYLQLSKDEKGFSSTAGYHIAKTFLTQASGPYRAMFYFLDDYKLGKCLVDSRIKMGQPPCGISEEDWHSPEPDVFTKRYALLTSRVEEFAKEYMEKELVKIEIDYPKDDEHEDFPLREAEPGTGYDCSICHVSSIGHMIRLEDCKHEFHLSCIRDWFERSNRCPLCQNVKTLF